MKVNITTSSFGRCSNKPVELLNNNFTDIKFNKFNRKLTANELIEEAKDADGIIAGTELYTKRVINSLPNIKVISRLGIGLDNIDIEAAKMKGVKIFTTKTSPAPAVAELTLSLMLDIARKISRHHQNIKSGIWKKEMGVLLGKKTLGIIGLGTIGKALVNLVKGFNFNILAFDMYHDNKFAKGNKINYCGLNTLLKRSDVVSIHLNLSNETKGLIDEKKLNHIKSEAILINTSRGEIIDETALFEALKSKQIAGAGLDVFHQEPYSGPLTTLDNVVLTPHIASYAKEIRVQMEIESVKNLLKGLNEKK